METEDRFVIPVPLSALFFPVLLLGLGGTALYYGVKTLPKLNEAPEYAALIPVGLFLLLGSFFLYRASSRPLVLDKKADRIFGYPYELSKALKVVVTEMGSGTDTTYVAELVFPDTTFRLSRAGWSYLQAYDADHLAKQVGKFLGIPAETRAPFTVSVSFKKGFYLTEEQAREAEKAGVKVDPKAIK